ncbi:histidine kinase [Pseudonocardia sp. N23]|uniref:ATP-binding protein n=1 Tax=Pseudonocardia sp. N23 TaxID=1987376 RepID=UPI000BFCC565|nr:histidine kinase [Pseudonocardia sp. N23]GAY10457.1 D-alanyl-D-alanine carboxypeptidase [Pseudonocardia sp. N23]
MDERENDPSRPAREHHAGHELPPFRMTGGTFGRNDSVRRAVTFADPEATTAITAADVLTAAPAPPQGDRRPRGWESPTVALPTGIAWTSPVPEPSAPEQPAPAAPRRGGQQWLLAGYWVLLAACGLLSVVWLVVGAVVGVAAASPGFAASLTASAAGGSSWAAGILAAVGHSEPGTQAALDYALSIVSIGLAVAMALRPAGGRSWSSRLLVLALIGSAGAFNLQAHAAASAVETATGLQIGQPHQILLHGVACAAYIVALLVFPPGSDEDADGTRRRPGLVTVGVAAVTLLAAGFGTALLPHTASCVIFFGFVVPAAGLFAVPRRVRHGSTDVQRTQARLLFSVLLAAGAVTVVLAAISLLVWGIGWTGLTLDDPTAGGAGDLPLALLFWFSRVACIAVAAAVLVAVRSGGLQTAERRFSRGLVVALDTAVIGGGYVLVHTALALFLPASVATLVSAIVSCVVVAFAFLPVHTVAERLVDRLLYGTRPTPYSVLAGIAALSRSTAADAPDLARVAEAVGRGLGATTCRLTVVRPGLRDRTYIWSEPGVHVSDELTEVAVRHGEERIGTIAVDRAAVAGLGPQRQSLLTDIADSLGAVLQASRYGIELERQLRAALAHAGEIAVSRRSAVAEMDGERRRIERDLHDGAQHHLVSLRLVLGLVEHLVKTGKFDQARERLVQVVEQIGNAESILAETATGVVSPLLSEHGLAGGLALELDGGTSPVTVDAPGLQAVRFPADVEAAVWFCCLEGVNNARKYAGGAPVTVRLVVQGGLLQFRVRDEGPGFDQASLGHGPNRGMRNLLARINSVGGRIDVRSRPGEGTTVEGSVPVPSHHEETMPLDAAQAAAWGVGTGSRTPQRTGGGGVPDGASPPARTVAPQAVPPERPAAPGSVAAAAAGAGLIAGIAATRATANDAPDSAEASDDEPGSGAVAPESGRDMWKSTPRHDDEPDGEHAPGRAHTDVPEAEPGDDRVVDDLAERRDPDGPGADDGALPGTAPVDGSHRWSSAPPRTDDDSAPDAGAPAGGSAASYGAADDLQWFDPRAVRRTADDGPGTTAGTEGPADGPAVDTSDGPHGAADDPGAGVVDDDPGFGTGSDAPPAPPGLHHARGVTPADEVPAASEGVPQQVPESSGRHALDGEDEPAAEPGVVLAGAAVPAAPAVTPPPPAAPPPPPAAPPAVPPVFPPTVPGTGAHRRATSDGRLIGSVRGVLTLADECYRGTPHTARLAALAARLDEPLRIAFAGPPGIGTSTLVEAVLGRPGGALPPPPTRVPVWWRHGAPAALAVDTAGRAVPYAGPWPPDPAAPLDRIELHVADPLLVEATIVDAPGLGTDGRTEALLDPGDPVPDALVLLMTPAQGSAAGFAVLHSGVLPHSRANTLGVLARADELPGGLDPAIAQRSAAELSGRSDVRRLSRTVLPVSGSLARAAIGLTPPEIDALARGVAVDPALAARLGPAGLGAAAALARTAPDPGSVVAGLLARSGVGRLRDLIAARFVGRSEILVARSVLQRLELLVRTDPPADARRLQYELERVRTGAHELAETDLLDELLAGAIVLPPAEVAAAEQLLGMAGPSPAARLGIAPDADRDAVRAAAVERLAYWQRAGSHPASSQALRSVSAVLVRTCEQLVASA